MEVSVATETLFSSNLQIIFIVNLSDYIHLWQPLSLLNLLLNFEGIMHVVIRKKVFQRLELPSVI